LTRLGLPDPKGYCRKRFKESPLLLLSSCCVGSQILDQIEGAIEEALGSQSWVDIMVSFEISIFNFMSILIGSLDFRSHFCQVFLTEMMLNKSFKRCSKARKILAAKTLCL